MQNTLMRFAGALVIGSVALIGTQVHAQTDAANDSEAHEHAHSHGTAESSEADARAIYDGYFEDSQIEPRALTDWEGDWQSVYPYLMDGTLAPVMAHKAEHGEMTEEEYRAYYETGYETDVDRIEIAGDAVRFHTAEGSVEGRYAPDGYEVLTYEKGNRGVRYVFAKTEGHADAPDYIQLSDHIIAPQKADHYHLYWGDDRAALLEELTNWPTYYPSSLSGDEIVAEMTAH